MKTSIAYSSTFPRILILAGIIFVFSLGYNMVCCREYGQCYVLGFKFDPFGEIFCFFKSHIATLNLIQEEN